MAICATVNRVGTNIVEKHQLDVGMYQEISPIVSHIFTDLLDGIPKTWLSTQSSWITPHILLKILNFLDRLMIVEFDKEPYDTTLITRQLALVELLGSKLARMRSIVLSHLVHMTLLS